MSEILNNFCELNIANYTPDDVERLSAWSIDAYDQIKSLEAELAELRKDRERMKRENGALRSAFHVNMLKAYPQKSHQEISDEIDNAMKEVK